MDFKTFSASRAEVLSLYNKTESDMKEYLIILRDWMKKQPHLPSDLFQDEFLEIYLIKCKFHVEKTKSKIENYCTMRAMKQYEYFYEDFPNIPLPSKEAQCFIPSPVLTDDYNRITICKVFNQEKYDMKSDFRNILIIREILSRYDYNDGEIVVLDFSDCTPMLVSKLRANVMADAVALMLKGSASRIRAVHFLGKIATVAVNITKPFVPSKLASRIHSHDDLDSLRKILPKKCLPKDYGGELKSLEEIRVELLDKFFIEHKTELTKFLNTKARDELRQASCSDQMQGTFKKLNID